MPGQHSEDAEETRRLIEGEVSQSKAPTDLAEKIDRLAREVSQELLPGEPDSRSSFEKELSNLINRHSQENGSDTPDWILAEYLMGCLATFNKTTNRRREWYGGKDRY